MKASVDVKRTIQRKAKSPRAMVTTRLDAPNSNIVMASTHAVAD